MVPANRTSPLTLRIRGTSWPIRLVAFDYNGTIVRDQHHAFRCIEETCRAFGVRPPTFEEYRRAVSVEKNLLAIFRRCGLTHPDGMAIMSLFRARYRALAEGGDLPPIAPGIDRVLEDLRACGVPIAVVTQMDCVGLREDLARRQLERSFDLIFCGAAEKATILHALRTRFRCGFRELLFVSDTQRDLIQARGVGCLTVAYTDGHGAPETLRDHGFDLVVASWDEFRGALRCSTP